MAVTAQRFHESGGLRRSAPSRERGRQSGSSHPVDPRPSPWRRALRRGPLKPLARNKTGDLWHRHEDGVMIRGDFLEASPTRVWDSLPAPQNGTRLNRTRRIFSTKRRIEINFEAPASLPDRSRRAAIPGLRAEVKTRGHVDGHRRFARDKREGFGGTNIRRTGWTGSSTPARTLPPGQPRSRRRSPPCAWVRAPASCPTRHVPGCRAKLL